MTRLSKSKYIVLACAAIGVLGSALAVRGCQSGQRLVEQFDNGPIGGPPGASEGYRWVGTSDHPSPGKSWKTVDPDALTPEQRQRIR